MATQQKVLLEGVQLGDLHLKNRFVLAPLTRCRADIESGVPTDIMVDYYQQRHQFGMLITEASSTSARSNTFNSSGNIFTEEQAQGWKKIVDAVHAKGALICMQIWHGGRTTNSSQIKGQIPVGPSAIKAEGVNRFAASEPYEVPHELTFEEVKGVVKEFRRGAELAKQAGFDAVELHSANSYLIDEFIKETSNQRTDAYGGSIENRCRIVLEILDEFIEVFGSGRVGVRFSPTGRTNGMYDSDPLATMKYLLGEIEKRNIAFVELRRYSPYDLSVPVLPGRLSPKDQIPDFFGQLRKLYSGNIIGNDSILLDEAEQLISSKTVQAVAFGVPSIRNPTLPELYEKDLPLNKKIDGTTYYTNSAVGYIEFPDQENTTTA